MLLQNQCLIIILSVIEKMKEGDKVFISYLQPSSVMGKLLIEDSEKYIVELSDGTGTYTKTVPKKMFLGGKSYYGE